MTLIYSASYLRLYFRVVAKGFVRVVITYELDRASGLPQLIIAVNSLIIVATVVLADSFLHVGQHGAGHAAPGGGQIVRSLSWKNIKLSLPVFPAPASVLHDLYPGAHTNIAFGDLLSILFALGVLAARAIVGRYLCRL